MAMQSLMKYHPKLVMREQAVQSAMQSLKKHPPTRGELFKFRLQVQLLLLRRMGEMVMLLRCRVLLVLLAGPMPLPMINSSTDENHAPEISVFEVLLSCTETRIRAGHPVISGHCFVNYMTKMRARYEPH